MFNDIGKHCQMLVDDFFHFCEGELDQITIITELRDISELMPPNKKQKHQMYVRCDKAWKDYCEFMLLPGESKKLFANRVRKQWATLKKQKNLNPQEKEESVEECHR